MKTQVQKCLILEWTSFPRNIKNVVAGWDGFHNDCYLEVRGELGANDYREGMKAVLSYWKDQTDTNDFKGSLEEFIKEYGLFFDVWLIGNNFDLTDIDKILVKVCW